MATIRIKVTAAGEIRYEAQIRLKGFPPQVKTFRKKRDAERWAQAREVDIRERRAFGRGARSELTLAEAIDRYSTEMLPRLAPSARVGRARLLGYWRDRLGHVRLTDLEPEQISRAIAEVERDGAGPATANRRISALSAVLKVAEREWGTISANPARRISRRREPPGRDRLLTPAERAALRAACAASANAELLPLVDLAIATAARQGELVALDWSRVDFGRRLMTLDVTKNGERRFVPLNSAAIDALERLGPKPAGPVFAKGWCRGDWEAAVERAGIANFRFHDLRHFAASMLAESGASLLDIAAILGHKTLAMVKRYSHLSSSHLSDVSERMVAKLKPTAQGDPTASD